MVTADVVDQLPRRGDGYTFGRDDHQVIAVGKVHRLEQWVEPFLFAEQYRAEIPIGTYYVDARVGDSAGTMSGSFTACR